MSDENSDPSVIPRSEIYREQYAHFRALNDILYKIPPLFSVAIGGLWYFAATQIRVEKAISVGLFLFSFVICLCGVNIFQRFGEAFSSYIDNLNEMDGKFAVTIKRKNSLSTVGTIKVLLWTAGLLSAIGAGYAFFQ